MLSNFDWTLALVNNLRQWDWDLYTKYEIDKTTADALIAEYEKMQQELKELRMRVDANELPSPTISEMVSAIPKWYS